MNRSDEDVTAKPPGTIESERETATALFLIVRFVTKLCGSREISKHFEQGDRT
jgi:hypothetical protein